MAERRMFAKTIIDSDAFLDMSQSTQLLYFHLSMRADDDGFINNPKSIMRTVRSSEEDLKMLIAKKFLIPFESGVVVIKHWKIHNYIAKDRYKETKYKDEKARLTLDNNNSYTECIHVVDELDTQVRLGKDRLDKDNKYILSAKPEPDERQKRFRERQKQLSVTGDVTESVTKNNEEYRDKSIDIDIYSEFERIWSLYPNKKGKDKAFKAFEKAVKAGIPVSEIEQGIKNYRKEIQAKRIEKQYIKHGSTWFNQKAWEDDYDIGGNSNATSRGNFESNEPQRVLGEII